MTRNELIASLVPSVLPKCPSIVEIAAAYPGTDSSAEYFGHHVCAVATALADEMIKRGIVKVSEEPKEPA